MSCSNFEVSAALWQFARPPLFVPVYCESQFVILLICNRSLTENDRPCLIYNSKIDGIVPIRLGLQFRFEIPTGYLERERERVNGSTMIVPPSGYLFGLTVLLVIRASSRDSKRITGRFSE